MLDETGGLHNFETFLFVIHRNKMSYQHIWELRQRRLDENERWPQWILWRVKDVFHSHTHKILLQGRAATGGHHRRSTTTKQQMHDSSFNYLKLAIKDNLKFTRYKMFQLKWTMTEYLLKVLKSIHIHQWVAGNKF